MKGEARVLQQRVQSQPVGGRRQLAFERVGGQQDEQIEADADPRLDAQGAGAQRRRQVAAEHVPPPPRTR